MTKKDLSTPWYIFAAGTFLSWLGLAGLADNIVEWHQWFEVGVMEHWRSVKHWIAATLLFWVPYTIPAWLVDYLVLGGVFIRSYAWNMNKRAANQARAQLTKDGTSNFSVYQHSSPSAVWLVGNFLFWPISLVLVIADYLKDRLSKPRTQTPQTISVIKMFACSILSFIAILMVTTDLMALYK